MALAKLFNGVKIFAHIEEYQLIPPTHMIIFPYKRYNIFRAS